MQRSAALRRMHPQRGLTAEYGIITLEGRYLPAMRMVVDQQYRPAGSSVEVCRVSFRRLQRRRFDVIAVDPRRRTSASDRLVRFSGTIGATVWKAIRERPDSTAKYMSRIVGSLEFVENV